MVRVQYDWPSHMPTGDSLLKMDDHWEKVIPLQKVHIPRERDAPRSKMSIEEISKEAYTPDELQQRIPELHRTCIGNLKDVQISENYQEDWEIWMEDLREFRDYELR